MAVHQIGETIICSITVKDADGTLQNAATSMKIDIEKILPSYASMIAAATMTNDGTGLYHYDYDSSSALAGTYRVTYTAVDASRTTKHLDTFVLD